MKNICAKLYVTNRTAFFGKYGIDGFERIVAALGTNIAHDAELGLPAKLCFVDDAMTFNEIGAGSPAKPGHQYSHKKAIDAIYDYHSPDYLILLGGPDVIPHIELRSPLHFRDGEPDVESDLPYASTAAHSRSIENFRSITRIVGRIPDITGSRNPDTLIESLSAIRAYKPSNLFRRTFAISALAWKESTEESMHAMFGSDEGILFCPDDTAASPAARTDALIHFINCHGEPLADLFRGQGTTGGTPIALDTAMLERFELSGVFAAAECCFGAQLYDPRLAAGNLPIAMSYMKRKAAAYVGSTSTSYGPARGNGGADLICQWFLRNAMNGDSAGASFLKARQSLVEEGLDDPVNLKTLAQFILIGDPSLHLAPEMPEPKSGELSFKEAGNERRRERRVEFFSKGLGLKEYAPYLDGEVSDLSGEVNQMFRRIAADRGVALDKVASFKVTGGRAYRDSMKSKAVEPFVLVGTGNSKPGDGAGSPAREISLPGVWARR